MKELVAKKMCRSIQQLRQPEGLVSDELIQAAALQYVRKVSGFRKPSKRNQEVFDQAVAAVAEATRVMLEGLESLQPLTPSPHPSPLPKGEGEKTPSPFEGGWG